MYKKNYLKSLLLLAMMLIGAGSAWAQDVTYDIADDAWTVSNNVLTDGTDSFVGQGPDNFKKNSGYFMMGKSGAYINFPTYESAVEKIVVTGRSGASTSTKMNVFVGDQVVSEETMGCTGTNTYEIDPDYQAAGTTYTLKVTSSHNAQITKIEVYFVGSSVEKEECDLTLTNPTNALTFDLYDNNAAQILSYSTSSTGAVTVTSEYVNATVDETNKTITVTPVKVTSGVQTVTVNQAADDNYAAGTATFTVNITNSAPATIYEKVTSANQLVAGNEYILVATENNMAMGAVNSVNANIRDNVAVTVADDQVSIAGEAVAVLTLGGASGAWTFLASDNNKYLALTASSNQIHASDDATLTSSQWVITDDFQVESTAFAGRYIMYNSGSPRFACYTGTQKKAYLFVKAGSEISTKVDPDLSFPESAYEVDINEPFEAPNLINVYELPVTYSSSNESVAIVDEIGSVMIFETGTTTITASFEGNDEYNAGSASYTLTVVDQNAPGTANNPYTVEQAREAIDANEGVTGVYATGIVSQIVTAYNSQYGNITYDISTDGSTESDQLRAYRGFSYDGEWFTSENDIQVGDVVVIYGNLTKYNDIYEFASGNQLVSLEREDVPEVEYYLAGSFAEDGWGEGMLQMTNNNGIYSVTKEIEAGTLFKVVMKDGDNEPVWYGGEGDVPYEIHRDWCSDIVLVDGQNFIINTAGEYTFSVNTTGTALTLNVAGFPAQEFFLTGDFNEWSQTATQFSVGETEGVYTLTQELTAGAEFKVYSENKWYGTTETISAENCTALPLSDATNIANMTVPADGEYTFTLEKTPNGLFLTIAGFPEPVVEYYLAGSWNGWTEMVELTEQEDGSFVATQEFPANTEFKFVKVVDDGDPIWYGGDTQGEGEVYGIHSEWCTNIALTAGDAGKNFIIEAEGNYTFTMNVTDNGMFFSVTGWPVPIVQYALVSDVSELVAGKKIILVGENEGTYYAMGEQRTNNRGGVEVELNNGIIIPGDGVEPITLENAEGEAAVYWAFKTADGYLYAASNSSNHLKSQAEIDDNAKAVIVIDENNQASIVFQGSHSRNSLRFNYNNGNPPLFACYAEGATTGSLAYIYMETDEVMPETVTAEVSAAGMATFCSEWALDFTGIEEVYAYTATVDGSSITYTRVYEVPARTGLVLRSLSGEAVAVEVPVIAEPELVLENNLVAVLEAIESLATNYDSNGYTNYILNVGSKGVGFYKAAGQPVGAGKAYLQVEGSLAKDFYGFSDGAATGIDSVDNTLSTDNTIYDLQGRKVMNPVKGIFIQNGKKVVVK